MLSISLIIITYNSEKFISSCLDSVFNQLINFNNVIIVDNNSQDNTKKIIDDYKNINFIELNYNSGYSKAANIGIEDTKSDLYVISNADILFENTFVANTIECFEKDTKIDMISPLIFRFDKKTIDSAGQKYSLSLYPKEIGYNKKAMDMKFEKRQIFSVCGAATVFSHNSLEKLTLDGEYYDEDFFMFWEDFDIGWRAKLLGLNIMFYPKVIVYHYRSATLKKTFLSDIALSLGRNSDIKYHLVKNRYLTLIKNFYFKDYWYLIPFIIFKDILWVGMLTISSPKIIIKLIKSSNYIIRAFRKRNLLRKMIIRNNT